MRVTVEPPMRDWSPRRAGATQVIATGHQPWLWHPGILAKYIAAAKAAARFNRRAAHVVVDTDLIDGLTLELPVRRGDALRAQFVELAPIRTDTPVMLQPPVDAQRVVRALESAANAIAREGDELLADLSPLIDAWRDPSPAPNLARQIARVLERLMRPYTGPLDCLYASELLEAECGRAMVDAMLRDARACATAYNRAAAAFPEARIRPLHVGVDLIELPLWVVGRTTREPVFAQVVGRDGEACIDHDGVLAPRALMLSAVMRSCTSDLFIHGRGGGVYDQVTEAWWKGWRGELPAPMTVVSADVTLAMDAPTATIDELARAKWRVHHLPFNLDRALPIDTEATRRKRSLIEHMDDDRDRHRRSASFAEIHAINDALAREHAPVLRESRFHAAAAELGVHNARVAAKRDWCFALYPPQVLHDLAASFLDERR